MIKIKARCLFSDFETGCMWRRNIHVQFVCEFDGDGVDIPKSVMTGRLDVWTGIEYRLCIPTDYFRMEFTCRIKERWSSGCTGYTIMFL